MPLGASQEQGAQAPKPRSPRTIWRRWATRTQYREQGQGDSGSGQERLGRIQAKIQKVWYCWMSLERHTANHILQRGVDEALSGGSDGLLMMCIFPEVRKQNGIYFSSITITRPLSPCCKRHLYVNIEDKMAGGLEQGLSHQEDLGLSLNLTTFQQLNLRRVN